MKFFLLKNIRRSFLLTDNYQFDANGGRHAAPFFTGYVPADITPFDQSSSEISKCELLKALVKKDTPAAADDANPLLRHDFWGFFVRFAVSSVNLRIVWVILPRGDDGNVLRKLADLFKGMTVQVDLSLLENEQEDARVLTTISSTDMTLLKKSSQHLFEDPVLLPAEYFRSLDCIGIPTLSVRATIIVTIPDEVFEARCGTVPLPQKMLEDGVLTDVTIVCGDGHKVQAHRNFLAARSSVFLAMFQTDMKESRESTVEISDMEEKTVRAFLKFLYYDDTKDAGNEFPVALELFKAGHKYNVKCLERKMKELILKKPDHKIDMEGALGLFLFARNLIPADEELMKKAARVLERYSDELQESPGVKELFQTDYKAAIQLLQYANKRN